MKSKLKFVCSLRHPCGDGDPVDNFIQSIDFIFHICHNFFIEPQNISSPSIQSDEPIYQQQSSSRLILIIGTIVFLFIAGIVGAYYLGAKQISKQLVTITPTPIPTQIPAVTLTPTLVQTLIIRPTQTLKIPDETANWKTIINQYFSFKSPHNWHYVICSENGWIHGGPEILKDISVGKYECEGGGYSTLAVVRNFGKFSIPVSIPQDKLDTNKYFLTVANKKDIQIDGENAIMQSEYAYPVGPNAIESIAVYIPKTNYTDSIIVSEGAHRAPGDPNTPSFLETTKIFEKILSTFKFIQKADQKNNTKTYINTNHHYSIKYPENYIVSSCNNCPDLSIVDFITLNDPNSSYNNGGYGSIIISAISSQLSQITSLPKLTSRTDIDAYSEEKSSYGYNTLDIYFIKNNKVINIEFNEVISPLNKNVPLSTLKNKTIFDQIVSSFQFID